MAPLSSILAESCACAFLYTWILRFGVPAVLTSNRGGQFTSFVWAGVCSSLGISASTTTAFHPQSNCMIERFHRSLKSALFTRLAGLDWFLHLPLVLLGLRPVPKDDTGLSVSEVVYGSSLAVPGEFLGSPELPAASFLRKIEDAIAGFAVSPPHHVSSSPPQQLPPALMAAEFEFVHEASSIPYLAPLYWGPYLVLERKDKDFRLQLGLPEAYFLGVSHPGSLASCLQSACSQPCSMCSGSSAFSAFHRCSCTEFCEERRLFQASATCSCNPYQSL